MGENDLGACVGISMNGGRHNMILTIQSHIRENESGSQVSWVVSGFLCRPPGDPDEGSRFPWDG